MKTQNIDNFAVATVAVQRSARLQTFNPDGVLLNIVVGGSGHAFANFDNHLVNAFLRTKEGPTVPILVNARVSDLLKFSDWTGGFSSKAMANATGRYPCYIPLGNLVVDGDDVLEFSFNFAAHATATYAVSVDAVDLVEGRELIKSYESVVGTGAALPWKDVEAVFLTSAATGAQIPIIDQESGNLLNNDYLVMDIGQAVGQSEMYETFGPLWSDKTKLTQDVTCTLPLNARALVIRRQFPIDRVKNIQKAVYDKKTLIQRMRGTNPTRISYLTAVGEVAAK